VNDRRAVTVAVGARFTGQPKRMLTPCWHYGKIVLKKQQQKVGNPGMTIGENPIKKLYKRIHAAPPRKFYKLFLRRLIGRRKC